MTDVPHDVPPEARVCDCGREKARIGEDVTEQLEYQPGKVFVYRHIYPKYACSCCKDGVTSAEPAASPIEGGLAGPGLLGSGDTVWNYRPGCSATGIVSCNTRREFS